MPTTSSTALCLRDKSLSHEAARLTRLVSQYGAADVDAAMAEALAKHAVSAASVAHLLDAQARKRGQLPAARCRGARVGAAPPRHPAPPLRLRRASKKTPEGDGNSDGGAP